MGIKKRIKRLLLPDPEITTDDINENIRKGHETIDRVIATINGDLDWFLCLTKNKEQACGIPLKPNIKEESG